MSHAIGGHSGHPVDAPTAFSRHTLRILAAQVKLCRPVLGHYILEVINKNAKQHADSSNIPVS